MRWAVSARSRWARARSASSALPLTGSDAPPLAIGPYVLAGGSVFVAAAIWLGTSGESAVRVGDAGVGVEKGEVRRIPWYALERVTWREGTLKVAGKDEAGVAFTIAVKLATQPQAVAWIVKEARERIPTAVDVPEDAKLPDAYAASGMPITLEPPQVVGRHCAASGKPISYEPDARVCPRCERVYHKAHVPDACACGASLARLKPESKAG
jgi:hypothetical protein